MAQASSNEKQYDVLGLGNVAVDDLLYVPHYPPADAKVRVAESSRQCGGLAATALVAASRLGASAAYAGMLGEDELSTYVEAALQREGVNVSHAVRRSDAAPTHSIIVVVKETGTRNIFYETAFLCGADENRPDGNIIRSARVLLIDRWGAAGMLRAARIAREAGIPVVADIENEDSELFDELFHISDHLIISEDFALAHTGVDNAQEAVTALWRDARHTVVVTCGSRGSVAISKEYPDLAPRHHSSFPVDVVDTTGCGDVFHGAYAAALAQGLDLDVRVRLASASAALKATRPGGQAGIPTRIAVEEFIQAQL